MVNKKKKEIPKVHEFVKTELAGESNPSIPLKVKKKKSEKVVKKDKNIKIVKLDKTEDLDKENLSDEKKIDQKLIEIYENTDGTMPDMAHFQREKRGRFIRSIIVLLFACIFLAVVAWVGFFVFPPKTHFSEKDVVLSISGEESVAVGEELQYRIRYRNAQNTPLTNVLLQVRYPEGFVLTDTSINPTNETGDEWLFGGLEAQESGFIDIFGKMYGNIGERQSFRIFLNYMAENFSSEFQKVSSANVELTDTPFDLTVEGPEEVVLGSEVELVITVYNTGEDILENSALEVDGGSLFSIRESEPKADEFLDNQWSIDSLDEEQKIVIRGVFNPDIAEEKGNIVVNLLGWKDADRGVDGYVYSKYDYSFDFLQTSVTANLVINGTTGSMTVQPGEVLNGTVVLRNAGDASLKNVTARVIFDAPSCEGKSILKWSEVENPLEADIVGEQLNIERRRGIFTWTSEHIKDLLQVDPNEEIVADFSLPIKSSEDIDLSVYTGSEIDATLEVRYDFEGEKKTISSVPIIMTLNSDTNFEVRDEITSDGDKELHNMTWIITNTFHELEDIRVEADVYGDITWNEDALDVPAGEVEFDEENQKIVWTIEKMPTALDVLALQFSITLNSHNPTQTNLTSKVTFEAMDTITNEQILKAGKEILLEVE
jgi:uncharacterized repeat protein (TIGR01451 family)